MGFTASGIDKDTVTTTQQAPLGFELTVPDGDNGMQTWIYVKAGEALSEGRIVMFADDVSSYTGVKLTTESGVSVKESFARVIGVAQHDIANNSYGFVLARGFGKILAGAGAALTKNTGVTPGGTDVSSIAGTGLTLASGAVAPGAVIGHVTASSNITASTVGDAYIKCL